MTKKLGVMTAISIAVLFLLPWAVTLLIKSIPQMFMLFALIFGVNPVFALGAGIYAGKDVEKLWAVPMIVGFVFLLSMWILFGFGETAFWMYTGMYILLGGAAMLLTAWLDRRQKK